MGARGWTERRVRVEWRVWWGVGGAAVEGGVWGGGGGGGVWLFIRRDGVPGRESRLCTSLAVCARRRPVTEPGPHGGCWVTLRRSTARPG